MNDRYDDKYFAWRQLVLLRDKHKCQYPGCKVKRKLEVHHIVPWSQNVVLRYAISNGIALCKLHHRQIKGKENLFYGMFSAIASKNELNGSARYKRKKALGF